MSKKQQREFGRWPSIFTPEEITSNSKSFEEIALDGDDIYWLESRPSEQGRGVIVRWSSALGAIDITPKEFNVRSSVHEYGGAAYIVSNRKIYFINHSDQTIYIQDQDEITPVPLISKQGLRFCGFIDCTNGLIAIAEQHPIDNKTSNSNQSELVKNFLVFIDYATASMHTIAAGKDFYAYPVLSPNQKYIAWISWQHPNMPWNMTELWIGEWDTNKIINSRKVAGNLESILEPKFSSKNELYFVSDRNNWWNIYRLSDVSEVLANKTTTNCKESDILHVCNLAAEFTTPAWIHGMSNWGFYKQHILASYIQNGENYLGSIDLITGKITRIELAGVSYSQLQVADKYAVFIQGEATSFDKIIKLCLNTFTSKVLACAKNIDINPENISIAQSIEYNSVNARKAKALLYLPANQHYQGLDNTLPPLIVKIHGGPTAMSNKKFDPRIQFWTSRGFALVDVNYGGSTGYGREYRDLLNNNWGVVDKEDCEQAALFLVNQQLVDRHKLLIRGSSAGGYTALSALTFGDVFAGGASYYGVSDLNALAQDTHKFEAHYLDKLIGKYPDAKAVYNARSPINSADTLSAPVIFFQGEKDQVVPINQAQLMVDSLKSKGICCKLVVYQGEQHGFRKAENIQDALAQELDFYLKFVL